MLWRDGRCVRHIRFWYWLLDTIIRVIVPGVQGTFFRARKARRDYALESLMDKGKRRELAQQMSTVTRLILAPHRREAEYAPSARDDE